MRLWLANQPEPVVAHWSAQMQGWLRDDDPARRVLHQVVGWAPCMSGPTQRPTIPRARKVNRRRAE